MAQTEEEAQEFLKVLRSRGIGGYSTLIPDGVGVHQVGIPDPSTLTFIPQTETFPVEEIHPPHEFADIEARRAFVKAQLKYLSDGVFNHRQNSSGLESVVGPLLEIPAEFASIDEFIQFKREFATALTLRSRNMDYPVPVSVCRVTHCLNPTSVPFEHCLFHLPRDIRYNDQSFVTICTESNTVKGHCTTPCSCNSSKCTHHRNQQR